MRNRLRRSAREALRNEYGENVIFLALKNPCEHFSTKMPKFRMTTEECFLEVLAVLDDIKEDEKNARFNMGHRWDKIYNDFRDLADDDTDNYELELATSMVVYCAILLLTMTNKPLYSTLAFDLMSQLEEHDSYIKGMKGIFDSNLYRIDIEKLKVVVIDYMDCDMFFSDAIEEMVEKVEEDSQKKSVKETNIISGEPETADLRIAQGKETSMIVVLDTMYKAGWFVDKNNKPVTNKKKTIEQILKYAFNKTNPNVEQTLNAAYKRNKADANSYFDELIAKLPETD